MTNSSATIVQKLWDYWNILRDDGMSYGGYLESFPISSFTKWLKTPIRVRG
jgi:type I restriction enzyme M protein